MLRLQATLRGQDRPLPEPAGLVRGIDRRWAQDAEARIREKASGGPGSRYLTSRTGETARRAFSYVTPSGAVAGARGPGVQLQEEGGTVRPVRGQWLTFRLHQSTDTAQATGRWVRARSVTIRGKHFVRDSVEETQRALPDLLAETLEASGW